MARVAQQPARPIGKCSVGGIRAPGRPIRDCDRVASYELGVQQMGWRNVDGKPYYYHIDRSGDVPRQIYVGHGAVGESAAKADAELASQRRAAKAKLLEQRLSVLAVGAIVRSIVAESRRLAIAALIASGYYLSRREWRRRSRELRVRVYEG